MAEELATLDEVQGPFISDERKYKDSVKEEFGNVVRVLKDKFGNDMLVVHDPSSDEISPNVTYYDALITDQGVYVTQPVDRGQKARREGYSSPAKIIDTFGPNGYDAFMAHVADMEVGSEKVFSEELGRNTRVKRINVGSTEQVNFVDNMLKEAKRVAGLPANKAT